MARELFDDYNPFATRVIPNAAFIPLIKDVMQEKRITHHDLAKQIGATRASLTRYLTSTRPVGEKTLQSMFLALGIDRSRAYVAVMELDD